MNITPVSALRKMYSAPQERAVRKQINALDAHCRNFWRHLKMISDQSGIHVRPETQEAMAKRYAPDL